MYNLCKNQKNNFWENSISKSIKLQSKTVGGLFNNDVQKKLNTTFCVLYIVWAAGKDEIDTYDWANVKFIMFRLKKVIKNVILKFSQIKVSFEIPLLTLYFSYKFKLGYFFCGRALQAT